MLPSLPHFHAGWADTEIEFDSCFCTRESFSPWNPHHPFITLRVILMVSVHIERSERVHERDVRRILMRGCPACQGDLDAQWPSPWRIVLVASERSRIRRWEMWVIQPS